MGRLFESLREDDLGSNRIDAVARCLKRIVAIERDVTSTELLEFITPTRRRRLRLPPSTLLALAETPPRGWLRRAGLAFALGTDATRLFVAPSWIVYGGGSNAHLVADAEVLFDLLSRRQVLRRAPLVEETSRALLGALATAPADVWPSICARLPGLAPAGFRYLYGPVVRLLPAAIKRTSVNARRERLGALRIALDLRRCADQLTRSGTATSR